MAQESPFAKSMGSRKFVRIKWAVKGTDVPFKEKYARVLAICPDSQMINLQPWSDEGVPAGLEENPWVNLSTIACLYAVPDATVVKTPVVETEDFDAKRKNAT